MRNKIAHVIGIAGLAGLTVSFSYFTWFWSTELALWLLLERGNIWATVVPLSVAPLSVVLALAGAMLHKEDKK